MTALNRNIDTSQSAGKYSPAIHELADIIRNSFGIDLPESKMDLIPRRLDRRLRDLKLASHTEYLAYLQKHWDAEAQFLANAITTNLTSFFREMHHFTFLADEVLPELLHKKRYSKKLRIWSAACSTGEEPYSIAMVLQQFADQLTGWDIKILATDLDTNILQKAYDGIYAERSLPDAGTPYYHSSFFKPMPQQPGMYQVNDALKSYITFRKLNFLDSWPMKGPFDIIFCRNALIYFDDNVQSKIVGGFSKLQNSGDSLFVGHSESLHGICDEYDLKGKTLYKRI